MCIIKLPLLLFAAFALIVSSQAEPVRVALVVRESTLQPVSDLLLAELSSRDDLILLERAEVERIQRELNLSAGNRGDFLRLGQMLGAQGLLVLETDSGYARTNLTTHLIAVQPGVVLGTARFPWPLADANRWTKMLARQLDPLFPKLGVLVKDALPISILGLRSAVKSPESQRLERELSLLLIERLSREKHLFVLERRRLQLLSSEKVLKNLDDSPFWNGSYLVQGTIDKTGFSRDTVTISAQLSPPNNATAHSLEASGSRTNLCQVADALATKLLAVLGQSHSAASWDPSAEAEQFFEEAQWAYQWKMFTEAQAACEAAWALGKQTRQVSRLRVMSYRDGARRPSGSWHFETNSIGFKYSVIDLDSTWIVSGCNAVESYYQDSHLTPIVAWDNDWQNLGVETFETVCSLLGDYHALTKDQIGHEEELSRLRSGTRQVRELLLSNRGSNAPSNLTMNREVPQRIFSVGPKVGWVWCDRPQDVLAEYRAFFNSRPADELRWPFIFRERTPWLIAWNDADRAAAPSLWSQFLSEICASTNWTQCLDGHLLLVISTSTEDQLATGEYARVANARKLTAAALQHQDEILREKPNYCIDIGRALKHEYFGSVLLNVPPLVDQVAKQYRPKFLRAYLDKNASSIDTKIVEFLFRPRDYTPEELRDFLLWVKSRDNAGAGEIPDLQFKLFKAYLAANKTYDESIFHELFHPEKYTHDQIVQIRSLLRRYRNDLQSSYYKNVDVFIKTLEASLNPAAPAPRAAALPQKSDAAPLVVNRFWKPSIPASQVQGRVANLALIDLVVRDDKVWAETRGEVWDVGLMGGFDRAIGVIYSVDLDTFNGDMFLFAPKERANLPAMMWSQVRRAFEVSGDYLYVSSGDKLTKCRVDTKRWEDVAVPIQDGVVMWSIGSRIYLSGKDSILELDPKTDASRVLASARRRPAVTLLDSLTSYDYPIIFAGPSGTIRTLIGRKIYTYDFSRADWTETAAVGAPVAPRACSNGLLLNEIGHDSSGSRTLGLFGNDSLETLLRQSSSPRMTAPMVVPRGKAATNGPTRWRLPEGTAAEPQGVDYASGRFWAFAKTGFGAPRSLLCFDSNAQTPATIPLQFTTAGEKETPTPGLPSRETISQIFCTPRGLVLTGKLLPGFWFLPNSDLEKALGKPPQSVSP